MRELLNQQHQDSSEFATLRSSSASTVSTMTYQQAYDKIIQAYFNDEIKPYECRFCFCGNLCDKSYAWAEMNPPYYSTREYREMESALLDTINDYYQNISIPLEDSDPNTWPNYEEVLFSGMSKALDVLKNIHRERGEDVDQATTPFTKRQLQTI